MRPFGVVVLYELAHQVIAVPLATHDEVIGAHLLDRLDIWLDRRADQTTLPTVVARALRSIR
jgi:hypothetical protein